MADSIEIMGYGTSINLKAKCSRMADIYVPSKLLKIPSTFTEYDTVEVTFTDGAFKINNSHTVMHTKIQTEELGAKPDYDFLIGDLTLDLDAVIESRYSKKSPLKNLSTDQLMLGFVKSVEKQIQIKEMKNLKQIELFEKSEEPSLIEKLLN